MGDAPPVFPAGTQLGDGGRYQLGRRIGVGGMAEVYKAVDRRLGDRVVAVKTLSSTVANHPFAPKMRQLFIQGAHDVLQQRMKQSNGLNTWLAQLTSRKRIQVAAVAMANKMARMVWAVLSKGEAYRPPLLAGTVEV